MEKRDVENLVTHSHAKCAGKYSYYIVFYATSQWGVKRHGTRVGWNMFCCVQIIQVKCGVASFCRGSCHEQTTAENPTEYVNLIHGIKIFNKFKRISFHSQVCREFCALSLLKWIFWHSQKDTLLYVDESTNIKYQYNCCFHIVYNLLKLNIE